MTKTNDTSQRTESANRRQQILDFLNAHPGSLMGPIGCALFGEGKSRSRHHNTIKNMITLGEVRFDGTFRLRRYYALVATTRSAEEVRVACMGGVAKANHDRHSDAVRRAVSQGPGYYLHIPSDKPIANQGGQGCVRRSVYVNCQQFY